MTEKLNPNSALYWHPATEAVAEEYPVNVPDTEIIEFDVWDAVKLLDGNEPEHFPDGELATAASDVGCPVFLRSDLSSAKHDGIRAVLARDTDEVTSVAESIVRDSVQKSMFPAAFLVREWVDIDHEFEAFDGLPIGVEFRVFATADEHLCTHYYWPEDSIRDASADEFLWTRERDEMAHARTPPWLGAAARMAAFEADAHHGGDDPDRAWSVDFARDTDGEWWLFDMALAEQSWHPDCDREGDDE